MSMLTQDPAAWLSVMTSRRIVVVGDAMLDRYWRGDVCRISPEAPVPVVQVRGQDDRPGGAANVAVNLCALGARVTLRSIVGDDEAGRLLVQLLAAAGVRTHLRVDAGLRTTMKLRVVARTQQMLRADFEDVPGAASLAGLGQDFEQDEVPYHAVLFSDYAKGALRDVASMIAVARARGVKVLVDPKGLDFSRYRGADVLTPNRAELQAVIGPWADEADLARRVQALCARLDIGALVLTRSEEGISLFDRGSVHHLPAHPVEIADVTGAGDSVIAVLAMLVAADVPLVQALPVANRAGALSVAKFGTATLSPSELLNISQR